MTSKNRFITLKLGRINNCFIRGSESKADAKLLVVGSRVV